MNHVNLLILEEMKHKYVTKSKVYSVLKDEYLQRYMLIGDNKEQAYIGLDSKKVKEVDYIRRACLKDEVVYVVYEKEGFSYGYVNHYGILETKRGKRWIHELTKDLEEISTKKEIPIEEPYVCISPTIGKIYRFSASITLNPFIIGRLIGFDNGMFVVKKHGKVGETCRMEYCDIERGELTQVDNIEEDKKLERINIDELAFGNNIKKERIKEEHLKGTLLYLQSGMNKIIDKINKGEK